MKYLFILVVGSVAYANEQMVIPPPTELPLWVDGSLRYLLGVPKFGPILYQVLVYIGAISSVMTGVASLFWFVCKGLERTALKTGFAPTAKKVAKLYNLIYPYLAFLSIYNAPKVKLPNKLRRAPKM